MNDLSSSISRVTEELNGLLKRLSRANESEIAKLIADALTLEVMRDFKMSVDAMRHLLWVYIEAASRVGPGDLNQTIHALRLQRAAEILRSLREGGVPISKQMPEARSFIEQIEALVRECFRQETLALAQSQKEEEDRQPGS